MFQHTSKRERGGRGGGGGRATKIGAKPQNPPPPPPTAGRTGRQKTLPSDGRGLNRKIRWKWRTAATGNMKRERKKERKRATERRCITENGRYQSGGSPSMRHVTLDSALFQISARIVSPWSLIGYNQKTGPPTLPPLPPPPPSFPAPAFTFWWYFISIVSLYLIFLSLSLSFVSCISLNRKKCFLLCFSI